MLYLLNLRKHSNQVELDQFFSVMQEEASASQVVTKSAFFQARKQLSFTAFTELNRQIIDTVYQQPQHLKHWKGFRLCAIDGTSIRLPNTPEISEYFGCHKGREGQANCTMGMASVFYDVLNQLVIDSALHPWGTSEKSCVPGHLTHANSNDLVIYDRGYPAFWLYAHHLKENISFCIRAKTNQCLAVKRFIASNKREDVVTYSPNKTSIKSCLEKGLPITPIKLRFIRVDLDNEVEVLVTNLMDTEVYDVDQFKSLYHLRWGIEENYKRLKQWVEIENISGKSVLSVKQDFYAKIVASNLTMLMGMAAQKQVDEKQGEQRLKYRINFAQALSKMKHQIMHLTLKSDDRTFERIERMINYISTTVEAVRPGRKAPRRLKNIKNNIHFPAYKCAL